MRFSIKAASFSKWTALCFLVTALSLHAKGKTEERPVLNAEWTFCITAFDIASLPESQQGIASIMQNRITRRLGALDARTRSPDELERYADAAWNAAKKEALAKLAAKRAERDALLYQGLPAWKYRQELKKIDRDIAALDVEREKVETIRPLVADKPVFVLAGKAFPNPPESGGEEAFLSAQNADAFLLGKFSSYYGRIYAELRVFARYLSFVYEESLLFSQEDLNAAADGLALRLEEAVSGSLRSALSVRASPEQAQVLINGSIVPNGEAAAVNPGVVSFAVSADGYESYAGEVEIAPGKEAETAISLIPLSLELLRISSSGEMANIYIGALFMGSIGPEGTLALPIPEGFYRYISAETEDGRSGKAIVLGQSGQKEERVVSLPPRLLPGNDEKPVEKRRRQFYGAWGRLWITLPLAFLVNGISASYQSAYNVRPAEFHDQKDTWYYMSMGAWIATGVFAAESLIRLFVYVGAANKEAVPLRE